MTKKLITLEDIYAKIEELIALEKHIASELVYLANDTAATKVMMQDLVNHFGLATDDYHTEETDLREYSRDCSQ